ncbi:hypothetical protein BKP43_48850 [Variovorax boronicumulans]|uniref:formate dehydrogenase n=1 Tax=Variovorax boronicumulans TaxID=436515 RepID=UPI000BB36FD1|nr:formate dehydrogenase [Variovorax boronicumulans]PBI85163.1 hypothetical protein BKP43_48850 [Variovorax boronicumulans]
MQDSQNTGIKPASRRGFFIGAATAGAAAVAVTALPKVATETPVAAATPSLPPPPENGGGYSLSEHVKRYYATTSA